MLGIGPTLLRHAPAGPSPIRTQRFYATIFFSGNFGVILGKIRECSQIIEEMVILLVSCIILYGTMLA